MAGRAVEAMAASFELDVRPVTASASIGVAICFAGSSTADELVAEADVAMYEAKRAGKGRAVRFSSGLGTASDTDSRDLGTRLGATDPPVARPE